MHKNMGTSQIGDYKDAYLIMLFLVGALFNLNMLALFFSGEGMHLLTDTPVVICASTFMLLLAFKFQYLQASKLAMVALLSMDLYRALALLMWQPFFELPYSLPVNNWLAISCVVSLAIQLYFSASKRKQNSKIKSGVTL